MLITYSIHLHQLNTLWSSHWMPNNDCTLLNYPYRLIPMVDSSVWMVVGMSDCEVLWSVLLECAGISSILTDCSYMLFTVYLCSTNAFGLQVYNNWDREIGEKRHCWDLMTLKCSYKSMYGAIRACTVALTVAYKGLSFRLLILYTLAVVRQQYI